MGISSSVRTPIGIDVGRRSVKAAQLSRGRNGLRVEAIASWPRPETDGAVDRQWVRQLRGVLLRQGFTGRRVVIAVPRKSLLAGVLEVPPRSSGAPVDQIARTEFARVHKRQPESFEMAWWDLPPLARASDTTQVMAVACPHAAAGPLLDAFEHEGLDVRALDVDTCALLRVCDHLMAGAGGITALLDLGWDSAQLAVLYKGVAVYQRTLSESGIGPLCDSVAKQLDVDMHIVETLLGETGVAPETRNAPERKAFDDLGGTPESHLDAMAGELQASFSYAVHLYPDARVERLLLVGGGAAIPGVPEYLGAALDTEVLPVAPKDVVTCPSSLAADAADTALTMAVGLAQFVEK